MTLQDRLAWSRTHGLLPGPLGAPRVLDLLVFPEMCVNVAGTIVLSLQFLKNLLSEVQCVLEHPVFLASDEQVICSVLLYRSALEVRGRELACLRVLICCSEVYSHGIGQQILYRKHVYVAALFLVTPSVGHSKNRSAQVASKVVTHRRELGMTFAGKFLNTTASARIPPKERVSIG